MPGRTSGEEMKYQGGEDYADPVKVEHGILAEFLTDFKALHSKGKVVSTAQTLLEVARGSGKPVDDKKMTMEKLIGITASLPNTSRLRVKLTDTVIDGLWDSLQHPPLSYMGDKYQYRQADGSYNNVLNPDLGKAGTAYAKTCKADKKQHAVRPDPGLLFDMLMARPEGTFKKNPAGVSSMLFYHATIIIHDIFRTNRKDPNISDTSSYLDLAPLYGSNLEEQHKVRTMSLGKLWPDTFHERRLLAQPPGVNVMLVMYSRFHNYVADMLYKINEGNRFAEPDSNVLLPEELEAARKKLDEDLFQTARLIVCGLYCNISLHDYLRGLTNCHHSDTDWAFDPRVAIDKHFDGHGTPRGIGNQVSAEFNLLYRFHSIISQRDEKWLEEFLRGSVFTDLKKGKKLEDLNAKELLMGLLKYEKNIPDDPKVRTFDGLQRDENGFFDDQQLVNILKNAIEEPAGLFGARMVPKALRVVEILGILQARKWGMASLNEFRDFFGLARHKTMEDINSDPEIADILRALYDHPDMVEMYPGLFLEDYKPELKPGCGGCPPYTVGRAVFSDAVTLVRSDRFYTIDYTAASLTNWGITEVASDYKVLAGSMLYKLIQRALPGWFPYNSLHVMQPFYTKEKNAEIAKELGTLKLYTTSDPAPPKQPKIVASHDCVVKVLKDQRCFAVPWARALNEMLPGELDMSDFMLGGDDPAHTAQRNLVGDILHNPTQFKELLSDSIFAFAADRLDNTQFGIGGPSQQIDILRDVAIPVNARILADLFCLDLKTTENPSGSLDLPSLYKHLLNVRIWGFNNNDPGMAWRRRMWAGEGAKVLEQSTREVLRGVQKELQCESVFGWLTSSWSTARPSKAGVGSLRWYGRNVAKELLRAGKTVEQAGQICWATALAGVGVPVAVFTEVLKFFLHTDNLPYWRDIQGFAEQNNIAGDQKIREYVLEAQRLTSTQRNLRVCKQPTTINGQKFEAGDIVVCLLGPACKDSSAVSEPEKFIPGRERSAYLHFGYGAHECLGREIALTFVSTLIKLVAGLKNLRLAPGPMGMCKYVSANLGKVCKSPKDKMAEERMYLNDNWSWLTFDPTTWKLHYDGKGKDDEVERKKYISRSTHYNPDWDIEAIKRDIGRMYAAAEKAKKAQGGAVNGAANGAANGVMNGAAKA